jgi:NADPH2:quinone reductase
MQAAYYTERGPAADVIEIGELPDPIPAAGEVHVRLATSGVNPSDVKSRSGANAPGQPMPFPRIVPHSDGAGVIDAVGPGVDAARIGERVWTWNAQWKRPFGTAASFITLPSEQAVRLPEHVAFDAGACLGIPAATAMQAIRLANVSAGMTVFISGGAGAVSHYAIQIAASRGARVITTVSGEEKAKIAADAGAAATINYRAENVGERVHALTGGRGAEALLELDLTVNAPLIPQVIAPHGTVVVYGMSSLDVSIPARAMLVNSIDMRFVFIYEIDASARTAVNEELTSLLERGALTHNIAAHYPLADTARAHEHVERGALGNVIVTL